MFHFKRQTLWIIIYVTIPLIIILNSLGPGSDRAPQPQSQEPATWLLDDITLDCQSSICRQELENTDTLAISALLTTLPTAALGVPEAIDLTVSQQGGFVSATFVLPSTTEALRSLSVFMTQWLPNEATIQWLISGEQTADVSELIRTITPQLVGTSIAQDVAKPDGDLVYPAPPLGHPDQLPFLLWIEIAKQRLIGTGATVVWDHRQPTSYAVFRGALPNSLFDPVEMTELTPILEAYLTSTKVRARTITQLHRYGVTAMVYRVPFQLFVDQPQRLSTITLESVNEMRERSIEQNN